jgi:hypothetical protein
MNLFPTCTAIATPVASLCQHPAFIIIYIKFPLMMMMMIMQTFGYLPRPWGGRGGRGPGRGGRSRGGYYGRGYGYFGRGRGHGYQSRAAW